MENLECFLIVEKNILNNEEFYPLMYTFEFYVIPIVGDIVSITNYCRTDDKIELIDEMVEKFKTSKFKVEHREIFPNKDGEIPSLHLFVTPYYGDCVFR